MKEAPERVSPTIRKTFAQTSQPQKSSSVAHYHWMCSMCTFVFCAWCLLHSVGVAVSVVVVVSKRAAIYIHPLKYYGLLASAGKSFVPFH